MKTEFSLPQAGSEVDALADQLTRTIQSGLPLESGLRVLAEQTRSRATRRTLIELSQKLEGGTPLADALIAAKSRLPRQMGVLVEAGLQSGRLDTVMQYCIEQSQRANALRQQIWLSLSYPIFLIWFSSLICTAILLLIVPSFGRMIDDFEIEVPLLTKVFITTAAFLTRFGIVPWAAVAVGGIAFWLVFLALGFSRLGQRYATSIPLLGRGFRYAALADFCQLMAILTKAGLPFANSLQFAGDSSDDRWLNRQCRLIASELEKGSTPSMAARMSHMPNSLCQVFREANSERTFTDALKGMAEIYSSQANVTTQVANLFISRMVVISVVAFAGLTATALFVPVIRLMGNLM